jgi:hypothetical protein
MKRTLLLSAVLLIVLAACSDYLADFEKNHPHSNPYDAAYNGPVGEITGKAVLDQQPLIAGIDIELRRSSDVPSQFLEISSRNTVPDNWNGSMLPGTVSKTQTDAQGNFQFAVVPVGTYILRISYAGYNTAWVSNVHLTENSLVTLPEPVTLTERVEGKILFLSNRDGFTEFYQMNSDGTEQERLTFNGINGWRDDDELIADLDYDETTGLVLFRLDNSNRIFLFDYATRTVADSIDVTGMDITHMAWGPGGSLYVTGDDGYGHGIWKIESVTNLSMSNIYSGWGNITYIDISSSGQIAFIEDAFLYEPDDTHYLFSYDEYSAVGLLDEDGAILTVYDDVDAMQPYYPLHALIPVHQVKILDDDMDPEARVQYTSTVRTVYPWMEEVPLAWGWGYDLDLGSNLIVYQMPDGDYYAYDDWELYHGFYRANSVWGVQWSPDQTRITFCDLYGSRMGYDILLYSEQPGGGYKEEYRDHYEWSYWYNVSVQSVDPNAPFYLGWFASHSSYNYAYDSLRNLSTAQPHWSTDGSKIVFVKGRPSNLEYSDIYDIFSWTDLDIWIMNSDNVNGDGIQKQLTFDPNKDFYPVWIPAQL